MAMACVQAQRSVSITSLCISRPLVSTSAAENTNPSASSGSLVLATNRKMNSMRPSYHESETNACHLGCFGVDCCIDPPSLDVCVNVGYSTSQSCDLPYESISSQHTNQSLVHVMLLFIATNQARNIGLVGTTRLRHYLLRLALTHHGQYFQVAG